MRGGLHDSFIKSLRKDARRGLAKLFFCCAAGSGLLASTPAAFGQEPGPMPSPASTQTVGIYLTAMLDIDPSRSSFFADFYLWTKSPGNAPDPLAKVTVVRAKTQTILYEWKEKFGDQLWSLRKYRCEMLNTWDLGNFPFDVHVLAIAVIPNSDEFSSPKYQVDEKNSGIARNIASRQWRLTNFKISSQKVAYETNFGDPNAASPYEYNGVTASFLLIRKPWPIFFKLMAGAYLAVGAAMLGCFMKTNQPPVFAGRMVLQIGCLFAAIINHRDIGNALGYKDIFMLTDALQLLSYLFIFASLVLTLRSRSLNESNQETRALRTERRITLLLAFVFLLLNVVFVWRALAATPNASILRITQVGD